MWNLCHFRVKLAIIPEKDYIGFIFMPFGLIIFMPFGLIIIEYHSDHDSSNRKNQLKRKNHEWIIMFLCNVNIHTK